MGTKKYYTLEFEVDNSKVDKDLAFHSQKALEDALDSLLGGIREYDHVRVASPERGVLRRAKSRRRR